MKTTKELFQQLTETLRLFLDEVDKHHESAMATDLWTVREVLAHVTFWHTNYAENYEALAKKKIPLLIDCPLYFANLSGVDSLRDKSVGELEEQVLKAHRSLEKNIVKKGIRKMTYKKNGRVYTSKEFLHVVERHIAGHIKQIKKSK